MASDGGRDSAWNRLPGNTFMRAIYVRAIWVPVVQKQICLNRSELGWTGQKRSCAIGGRPLGFAGD